MCFFLVKFVEELQNRHPATFGSSKGSGKANKYLSQLGYYPLFANVAEAGVFSYDVAWWKFWKKDLNRFDQVLNTQLDEVMAFIEYKSATAQ